jgi:hypothetical protein
MRLSMTEKSVDADARADKAWLLNVQRKLYHRSGVGRIPKGSTARCGTG